MYVEGPACKQTLGANVQVNMTAGSAYAIVLDGYNGLFGKYQIDITAEQVMLVVLRNLPACLSACLQHDKHQHFTLTDICVWLLRLHHKHYNDKGHDQEWLLACRAQ